MAKKLSPDLPKDHPEVIEARISEIERKIDRLKALYENYFMGAERMPPNTPRRELNRLILELQQIHIRNSGLKFRFQTILQRWGLYTTYWNRTMREIESGTYRKDVARAQRHMAAKGTALTEEQAIALGIPARRAKAFVYEQNRKIAKRDPSKDAPAGEELPDFEGPATDQTPAPVLGPAAAEQGPAPTSSRAPGPAAPRQREFVPGMSEEAVESLHRRYEEARRKAGDSRAMNMDQLRAMLRKQIPKIMQEHMAFAVDFDVAVKEGRVVLRAKPVK